MSEENVELYHRANEAFNRRDLDAFLEFCHPEVQFFSRIAELEGGRPYRGPEGLRKWWESLFAISPDFMAEIEEVRDFGDVLVARVRNAGHGGHSGAPMGQVMGHVFEWRDRQVISWRMCRNEAEALEAAGLSE